MPQVTRLPRIYGNAITGQSDDCPMTPYAAEFAQAWLQLLGDRPMHCDARLCAAAQGQAEWLGVNDFDEGNPHLGAGGSTANQRVRAAGYRLPTWHGDGNTVESATHSPSPPADAAEVLAAHDTHYLHMHCLGFWEPNHWYGVGAAQGREWGYFYCVVTAPAEE